MKLAGALVFAAFVVAALASDLHPLSDEFIMEINAKAKTWKAGRNFAVEDWEKVKKIANGAWPKNHLLGRYEMINPHDESEDVPEFFDAREQWPACDSLKQIRDQSSCGSCWAFAAAEAMSDRICIHSDQTKQVYVSAEDINSCCSTCGFGCGGGYVNGPWHYWQQTGIVTGGLYNSSQGCKDYSLQPCEHHVDGVYPSCDKFDFTTPACTKTCYDSSLSYNESLTYGQQVHTFKNEKQIQLEILKKGPVEARFNVYADFVNYKSGVYQATVTQMVGGHAIKIVGWGVEEGVKYWLIANSWNAEWGENGYFKFLRGVDHCGIESDVVASLPKL